MMTDIDSHEEIRVLMNGANEGILECMRLAQTSPGGLARYVVVVKLAPAGTIAIVMLCDRAGVLAQRPKEMVPTQVEMLAAEPKEGEILVLLFAKNSAGVGRVTEEQAKRFAMRRTN